MQLVAPDNTYARLAQGILNSERPAAVEESRGIGRRGALVIAFVAFVLLVGLMGLVLRPRQLIVADVPPTATPAPTAEPLPDRSRPLTANAYTARYAGGILQVTAVEDDARRIVNRDGAQVQPVPGARFYAVELAFECRVAICQQPPRSRHIAALQTAAPGIDPRETAFVQNEASLTPVALGVTTRGWMVFEIPSIIAVSGLDVTAPDSNGVPTTQIIGLE